MLLHRHKIERLSEAKLHEGAGAFAKPGVGIADDSHANVGTKKAPFPLPAACACAIMYDQRATI